MKAFFDFLLPAAARGARALIAWASTLARRDCFRPPLGAAVAFEDFAETAADFAIG